MRAEHMRHICILSLALIVSISAFFAQVLTARAAYNLNYYDYVQGTFTLRVPVISDFQGIDIYDSSTFQGLHYELDYDISANLNTYSAYNAGFHIIDFYLYFYLGTNINYSWIHNFNFVYDDTSPDLISSDITRCTFISLNDGFAFHFSLIILFDNYFNRSNTPFSIGNIHFNFDISSITSGLLSVKPFDRNDVSGISWISASLNRNGYPANQGLVGVVAEAINTSTDVNTIITLLTGINGYSEDAFNELTYIYNTNQNIYNRLGAILDFLQGWQYQTDSDMQTILGQLEAITEINHDIISQLPSFSWDEYGQSISDFYSLWEQIVRPVAPTGRDTTLVWSWIGGTWPVYIIGLVLILGTISFVLYGKK